MTQLSRTAPLAFLFVAACAPDPTAVAPVEPTQTPSPTAPLRQGAPTSLSATAPAAVPAVATPALALDGEGLRLFNRESGSARPIAFASHRVEALAMLGFRGPPRTGTQSECGAGALDYAAWPDGLKLYFQRGKFVGWAVDSRAKAALATAAGIGPGSSRGDISNAYSAIFSKTTLGTEFAAGGLFGLLDGAGPTAKISDMWAGTSCNFR